MEKKLLKFVLAFLLLAMPAVSFGQLITIGIEANVYNVLDPCNLLEGKVHVGSKITGTYTYDTNTPDTNPASDAGEYLHYSLPSGLNWTIEDLVFKTDPCNTNFLIRLEDERYDQGDRYFVRSFNNLPLYNNNVEVGEIMWVLWAYPGSAISSTVLPTTAPVLTDWNMDNYLHITGGTGGIAPCWNEMFDIMAEVTSAVLIPEPMSLLLFGFGLLAFRLRRIN